MTNLTPEWVVATLAVLGIVFHAGYTWQMLSWLRENAATKSDMAIMRSESLNAIKDGFVSVRECSKNHEAAEAAIQVVKMDVNTLQGMVARSTAEIRALQES